MATNLASARALETLIQGSRSPTTTTAAAAAPDPLPETHLAQFGLTPEAIAATPVPPELIAADVEAARKRAQDLRMEHDALEAEHAAEVATVDEAVSMIRGRQLDYTPAIHEWVSILAEKGALRELIAEIEADAAAAEGGC